MKIIIGTMIGFYILNFWITPYLFEWIFPWGGVRESYFQPIYMGMILLAGLIVACTLLILEEIRKLNK